MKFDYTVKVGNGDSESKTIEIPVPFWKLVLLAIFVGLLSGVLKAIGVIGFILGLGIGLLIGRILWNKSGK